MFGILFISAKCVKRKLNKPKENREPHPKIIKIISGVITVFSKSYKEFTTIPKQTAKKEPITIKVH